MQVAVIKKTYTNEASGEVIPYERLALSGYISGELHTLELKLSSSELMLVKVLLANDGKIEVKSGKANAEDRKEYEEKNGLGDFLND